MTLVRIAIAFLLTLASSMTTQAETARSDSKGADSETFVLGGGCFWCLEAVYDQLRGVTEVVSGYAGGRRPNPTYAEVSSGTTGHAEVVRVTFDPRVITRHQLLDVYFTIHDPTTRDRQGADVGPQYRSIAFYSDDTQKQAIEQAIERARVEWKDPIVTEVAALPAFYPAEDYHQQYFELHGEEPYCSLVIAPKVAKFRQRFAALSK
jgi:peptide-methionine (S)-S-oxide reductase